MAFWGVEVKPRRPFTYRRDRHKGRLHISTATLSHGSSLDKSVLQCAINGRRPIFLCMLSPGQCESSSINVEFEEDDDVIFSIFGSRGIHILGYFCPPHIHHSSHTSDLEPVGEDIDEESSSSHDSSDYDYDDDFIDDSGVFPDDRIRMKKRKRSIGSDKDDLKEEFLDDIGVLSEDSKKSKKRRRLIILSDDELGDASIPKEELIVEDICQGDENGEMAYEGKKVHVKYVGMLLDSGEIVQKSKQGRLYEFYIGDGKTIDGFDEGVRGMRVGGRRRLVIPPSMGYGQEGWKKVPGNAWLTYEVELVKVCL
ncbi:peptidyl-prolyl cis-trans isomerase FKBP43-like isoform X1 [Amborella trichopoda]|uniref:peptidyl-prolyl cis-trans isomerase FKBP43-like isoform X1 n=1 Tax=Amborella trichopoda TaxID=13333 RepID=UPI0009BD79EA|nr:peptidyl-prolyl cis-trans isomerase FKBP43-like isoform X1 [Amborella trichopoda]|eukprot:XP_020521983.1 peptidyl-prolyl cis-trans isomerase FKBP43-like isoform X1 [Amborella trichopoda]